jgi:hypothetical protein
MESNTSDKFKIHKRRTALIVEVKLWAGLGHLWGFWWGIMRERDHLEDLGIVRGVILKWIINE